jgi:2-aminoadipate transaminase
VHAESPHGGLFIWLQLPDHLPADELLPHACEFGVDFAPGNIFSPDGSGSRDHLRLNFVVQPSNEIEEGIKRLGMAIKRLRMSK